MSREIIVLKFGSSVLQTPSDVPKAVHEIYRWYRDGHRVVVIVSAIGQGTNWLLNQACEFSASPDPHALAELLATGERASAALFGIALDRAGVPARVVDPREIRLTALGQVLNSEPVTVLSSKLEELLSAAPVLVVPGFFGHDAEGRLHLLGRGGSDLSAVFLAGALGARRCRLIKDVDGVYDRDPTISSETPAQRLTTLDYRTAVEKAAPLIQPKAVRFLERQSASAEVAGLASSYESIIGRGGNTIIESDVRPRTSVLLLGFGTVGFGVYRRLRALPQHFQVIGALCLDPAKHEAEGVPQELLHGPQSRISLLDPDVVVDALPGVEVSRAQVRYWLDRGVSVVSANKRLVAEDGQEFAIIAEQSGARLRYSAAVGGSAPMIEAIRAEAARGEIRSIAGVLNGTCNYVLDRCAEGLSLAEAIAEAQAKGFAEADPAEDLSGADAGRKLRILCRHAFGSELTALDLQELSATSLAQALRDKRPGQFLRIVARSRQVSTGLVGEVRLTAVDPDDPLASVHGEWNRLVVTRAGGSHAVVSGRGAGRWPTTEAVIADLLEWRHRQRNTAALISNVAAESLRLGDR
ncbi:MAG: homoserine dehydrogenase [Steroidobacteraceae bacterium]